MKKTNLSLFLLALATVSLIMLSSCKKENISTSETEENEVIALKTNPNGPSAVGAGTFLYTHPVLGTHLRHFSFHANTMPQGHVQGNGVLTYNSGVVNIQFDIDCLSFKDDKTAIMTGKVTSHSNRPDLVDANCWFKVVDNGEGINFDPDEITLLFMGGNLHNCSHDYFLQLWEITGGNIQVNPEL